MTDTGRRFGHYTLLGRLGAGGMGEVSLARDDRLGREVALKMLPKRLARDAASLQSFRREALTLASLNHPNIAVIHGFEQDDATGALALVLERVEGESLADRLDRGPLPPIEAVHICAQIADALEVAHERGVIHRDLKPSNVMLAPRGLVKVLDFGLARRVGGGAAPGPGAMGPPAAVPSDDGATIVMERPATGSAANEADTINLTRPGQAGDEHADTVVLPAAAADDGAGEHADTVVVPPGLAQTVAAGAPGTTGPLSSAGEISGTPGYMSPEQVRGEPQDDRTDVFAFGCVLYECLTGARAVQGNTIVELMQSALDTTVDLAALPERTPAPVRDLLARCLERDATRRLSVMRDARHTLEEVLGTRRAAALRAGEAVAIPNNLPAAVTSFVGRERELTECARQLEGTRWLTLVGMGGSGKTRLARRLAEQVLETFPDGVWFVDLTALKNPERVSESLAEAAGIQEEPGTPIMKTLCRTFAERRVLLVLDNCEDVLDPVSEMGSQILGCGPGVKLLATSREPIGAPGEVVVPVAPLGLPEESVASDPSLIAATESVRLFVERAVAASPAFTLSTQNAGAVAEICRRLDGIPLAIELAAARVRMLSVEEVRARLGDRFKLLTASGRGAPARHQTLRATIQWSVDHLSDDERELYVRLGVFVGAWSLESAVAVAGENRDEFEVLDAMTRLVDRSLVVVTPSETGETRYRYLETVRTFALERLTESGEEARLRDRHLEFFLSVAEESRSHVAGPERKRWLARLDAEHSDFLAAHAWCGSDAHRAVLGLQLAAALWGYWAAGGHFAVPYRTLREALARPGAAVRNPARAEALVRAGAYALTHHADHDSARSLVEESLSISRDLNDRLGVARCLAALSVVAVFRNDMDEAHARSSESLDVYRELGRPAGVAIALHTLGYIALTRGELNEAQSKCEEALKIFGDLGDERQVAHTLVDLGRVSTQKRDWDVARARFATALQLARNLNAKRETAYALEGAAELAALRGQAELACRVLGAAQALRVSIDSPRTAAESKDLETLVARLGKSLGAETADRLMAEGRTLSAESAAEITVGWLEQDGGERVSVRSDGVTGA